MSNAGIPYQHKMQQSPHELPAKLHVIIWEIFWGWRRKRISWIKNGTGKYLGALGTSRLNHVMNRSLLRLINQCSHVNGLVQTVSQPEAGHSRLYTSYHIVKDRLLYQKPRTCAAHLREHRQWTTRCKWCDSSLLHYYRCNILFLRDVGNSNSATRKKYYVSP